MVRAQLLIITLVAFSCSHKSNAEYDVSVQKLQTPPDTVINLNSFYKEQKIVQEKVDSVFNIMSNSDRVAQLLMPAVGTYGQEKSTIDELINEGKIGGLLLLNGSKDQFTEWVKEFEGKNAELGKLPFLYSADAEPTLVNRKIKGTTPVSKAVDINSENDARKSAEVISNELNEIGINYNFAPVVDLGKNATVGYRGFGKDPKNIIPFSSAFIEETQDRNIIATAKHFPGHGLVSGDTHKSLQVIDGELKELKYYPPLIENNVLSIMVAHIAVQNNYEFNTKGMPATTSHKIVTELLRDSLGFEGLIVTDAMNMGGVAKVKDATLLAITAGCDIILMPLDARKSHERLLSKYESDDSVKTRIDESAKRVIRMKLCLGLIN
jgi:beta-N-acetylhexosaminidase